MKVLVTTPYEKDSLQGNTVTAKRVVSILLESGIDAAVLSKNERQDDLGLSGADVLIALHARKSAPFIEDFLGKNAAGKVIVYLTGTDLYSDIPNGCTTSDKSLEIADALVVSQEASLASVPDKYRAKASVVHKSIELPELLPVAREPNLFSVIGHLRAVKQPFMAVESLQLLDDFVRLALLGKEVDADSDEISRKWQADDPRFQWLGGVSHVESLHWMMHSVATINSSLAEGGANSVGESIVLGVPVLASRIEGNRGMLGDAYDGYFSPDSKQELAGLMHRVIQDVNFLERLREQVRERSKKFLRENEAQDWVNLLGRLRK